MPSHHDSAAPPLSLRPACSVGAVLLALAALTHAQGTTAFPELYDVRAFGAVGDGVTDDSAAIQAALDAAVAARGGTVYLPTAARKYRLESGLVLSFEEDTDARITVRGESDRSALLAAAPIEMLRIRTTTPNVRRVTIQDVMFNGDGVATAGLVLENCAYDRVLDCHFANFDGKGVAGLRLTGETSRCLVSRSIFVHHREGAAAIAVEGPAGHNLIADNVIGEDVAFGVDLRSGAHDNVVSGNMIWLVSRVGVRIEHSDRNLVQGNVIESCADHGVQVTASSHGTIANNQIRTTGRGGWGSAAVRVSGSENAESRSNKILGNQFTASDRHHIELASVLAVGTEVAHNSFDDSPAQAKIQDLGVASRLLDNGNADPVPLLAPGDGTPRLTGHGVFRTANRARTVLTGFDTGGAAPEPGREVLVLFGDDRTVVDFTSPALSGNGGKRWSPVSGDSMHCVWADGRWHCRVSAGGRKRDVETPRVGAGQDR